MPKLIKGESIAIDKLNSEQHFTEPPARFNEATLVKHLEELGIGRPSTYTSIISTLLDREYVENEQKRFCPTDVGEVVCNFLNKHFDKYVEYGFTANLEDELDAVSRGESEWVPLMTDFGHHFTPKLNLLAAAFKEATLLKKPWKKNVRNVAKIYILNLGNAANLLVVVAIQIVIIPQFRWIN